MIQITIPPVELYNDETSEFITLSSKPTKIQLEHSLISLKKWESKWHKPFLAKGDKTAEETFDYIRCMTLTPNINPELYRYIPAAEMRRVAEYINDPMTATWFREQKSGRPGKQEVITAEVLYYYMITMQIPFECQKWHLNQLLTLIRVIGIKNSPKKKRSASDILTENARLNAMRKAQLGTKG